MTGTSGFVGPHLLRELVEAGHDLSAIDRKEANNAVKSLCSHHTAALEDLEKLQEIIGKEKPEAVIHLAGWSHIGHSWDHPREVLEANVIGTVNLYTALAQAGPEKARLLFVSSADVYGSTFSGKQVKNEDTPVCPETPYAVSKYSAEQMLGVLRNRYSAEVLIVRPFNHIGPGQSPQFACPSFARQIAEIEAGKKEVFRHGNLEASRDFLDVRDVVHAYRLILENGHDGDKFVVASGISVTMQYIVDTLFEIGGVKARREMDKSLLRRKDHRELTGDPSLIKNKLSWAPKYELQDTLKDILDEARKQISTSSVS